MSAKPGLRGPGGSTCHMAQRRTLEKEAEQQNKSTHAFRSMRISHCTVGEDASVTVCCQDDNADGRGVWKKRQQPIIKTDSVVTMTGHLSELFFPSKIFLQNIFFQT